MGQNKWRAASDCPAGMRAELPHVLRDHAVIREQTGIDLAPGRAWDSRRVSLSAAASLAGRFAVWRTPGRLSHHGRFGGLPDPFSIFFRNEQFRADAGD